jgi:hypothetical protein
MLCAMPSERQLDLFAAGGTAPPTPPASAPAPVQAPLLAASELADEALIVAIADPRVVYCNDLAQEAVRRRLMAAVPAFEGLCRRFKGFGLHHAVPEQTACVRALDGIGGRDAAQAITRIIVDQVVQGPGLAAVVQAAARLECRLPAAISLQLLRHADPSVRADAARCARPGAEVFEVLVDLLGDLHETVATAAACALGRMGRVEARPMLLRVLRAEPSAEVIDAVGFVADEECIVLLGRIARTRPDLAACAIAALEQIAEDDVRAAAIVAAIGQAGGTDGREGR